MKNIPLEKLFRGLAITSLVCYLLFVASPWLFDHALSQETYDGLGWRGYGAIIPLPEKVLWLVVLLWIGTTVGICQFHAPARLLFALLTAFGLITTALGGMVAMTALESLLAGIMTLLDGAILTLAYLSPLKEKFELKPDMAKQE